MAKDLTGKRFGRLTVIKRMANNRHSQSRWLCKCECGKECTVTGNSLRSGCTKSCGCLQLETRRANGKDRRGKNIKDLAGMRFGRLTVVREGNRKNYNGISAITWMCKCDCGNYKEVTSNKLLTGVTKSCGCLHKEMAAFNQVISVKKTCYKDTRPCNLNSKIPCNNSSGYKGVGFFKRSGKWTSVIQFQGKKIFLGYFDKKEDAIKARKQAEEKYFKPIIQEFEEVKCTECQHC